MFSLPRPSSWASWPGRRRKRRSRVQGDADKTITISGSLQLPTVDRPLATIAVDNGDPDRDNISTLEYRFDQQGKLKASALSDPGTWMAAPTSRIRS